MPDSQHSERPDHYEWYLNQFHNDCTAIMMTTDPDMIPGTLRKGIDRFIESPVGGLWIRGDIGTGKTMAMKYAGEEYLLKYGSHVRYVNVVSMFNQMRADLDKSSELLEDYVTASLLLLDDIGKEKMTAFKEETLYYIIDQRYSNLRRTCIATNISGDQLAARCGAAVVDRIVGMCKPIVLKGNSLRRPPE